jgi:tRNA(Ile)-lysidine synthase
MAQQTLAGRLAASLQRNFQVRPGERIGVAVSGGADSVALLLLLLEVREKLGMVLGVVHFNHKLRGRASGADEKFVAKVASKHGLAFHVERVDVAASAKREKANLEDAARRARYAFFTRLVEEGHVNRVAVAHTADDQAETVLAHILRGTGLAGLGGIHPVAGCVIRPLLHFRRAELRTYLRGKKQTWREDITNIDVTRMRARIRAKLLPLLEKQFQPAVVQHLGSLAELAREDEAYLELAAGLRVLALAKEDKGGIRIAALDLACRQEKLPEPWGEDKERPDVAGLSRSVEKRMVRQIVDRVKLQGGQLGAKHVEAVLELARHGQGGTLLQLPGSVEVRREGSDLFFSARASSNRTRGAVKPPREYEYKVDLSSGEAHVPIAGLGCAFRFSVIDWPAKREETNRQAVLDRDRLQFPLVLRNWRHGDKFCPAGHQKPHKLKRLFQEKRISRWERDGWPVLTSGGVLVWARRLPVAAGFAANEETRAGILIAEETE